MWRTSFVFSVVFLACGGQMVVPDGGNVADAGNPGLSEAATAAGTYGFQVRFAKAFLVKNAAVVQPTTVLLLEGAQGCPARLDQPPAVAGEGLVMQARVALVPGSYTAPAQVDLIRGHFSPDAGFPTLRADGLTGTMTITSDQGGLVGSYQFTSPDGGTLSGQFEAPWCGPYCGAALCP